MNGEGKAGGREKRSVRHQRFNVQGSVSWTPPVTNAMVPPALPPLPKWASERYSERFLRNLEETAETASPVTRVVVKRDPVPPATPPSKEKEEPAAGPGSAVPPQPSSPAPATATASPAAPSVSVEAPAPSCPLLGEEGCNASASSQAGSDDQGLTGSAPTSPAPSAGSPASDNEGQASSASDSAPERTSDSEGSGAEGASSSPRQHRRRNSTVLHSMLDVELRDFVAYMQLTPEERQARQEVAARVAAVTKKLFPDSEMEVFGSWSTDLALPSSDIDVTLCGVEASEAADLAQMLQNAGFSTHLIATSKVPILRLTDPVTGVHADISFNMSRAAASAANMKRLLQKYPLARTLIIALKSILKRVDINEVYTGGLSSYSLSLMVVSYLQMTGKEAEDEGDDEGSSLEGDNAEGEGSSGGSVGSSDGQSQEGSPASVEGAAAPASPSTSASAESSEITYAGVGRAFLGFLEMYGLEPPSLDFENLTISVARAGYIPKKDSRCAVPGSLLSLEDPLCPENDVAKGTFRFMDVRMLFHTALKTLRWYEQYSEGWEMRYMGQVYPQMNAPPATPLSAVFGCDPRDYPSQGSDWHQPVVGAHRPHAMVHAPHMGFHGPNPVCPPMNLAVGHGAWYPQAGVRPPYHVHQQAHAGGWGGQGHYSHQSRRGKGNFFGGGVSPPKDGFGVLNRQGTSSARSEAKSSA